MVVEHFKGVEGGFVADFYRGIYLFSGFIFSGLLFDGFAVVVVVFGDFFDIC